MYIFMLICNIINFVILAVTNDRYGEGGGMFGFFIVICLLCMCSAHIQLIQVLHIYLGQNEGWQAVRAASVYSLLTLLPSTSYS